MTFAYRVSGEGWAKENCLTKVGPYVPVNVFYSPERSPIFGHLLVDTGARRTTIDESVLQEVGALQGISQQVRGAGGVYMARLWQAHLELGLDDHWVIRRMLLSDMDPDVAHEHRFHINKKCKLDRRVPYFIGLLGRDILSGAGLTYKGPQEEYLFTER